MGFTALDVASFSGSIGIVHLFLQAGADTHIALHMAQSTHVQEMLLAAGADPSMAPKRFLPPTEIKPETKNAARKWLQSLECAQKELMKLFDENRMLVQEVKDFIYTESFLK